MSNKPGICAYCGKSGTVTRDHVPPKNLFVPPLPSNLITVPACPPCHSSFKMDDEYFRIAMSFRPDVYEGRQGPYLWAKTLGSIQKPEARGLRRRILNGLKKIQLVDDRGREVDQRTGYSPEYLRLKSTAVRLVRGFYYHYFGKPLPQAYDVAAYFEELQQDHSALQSSEVLEIMQMLSHQPLHERGEGVVSLRYLATAEDANATVWVIRILGSAGFIAFTAPPLTQT